MKKRVSKLRDIPENSKPVEKALIENLISMQKVYTNLAQKFDSLS